MTIPEQIAAAYRKITGRECEVTPFLVARDGSGRGAYFVHILGTGEFYTATVHKPRKLN